MLNGLDIIVSHHLEPDYAELWMPKFSEHRSVRVWKKLIKKRRTLACYIRLTAFVMNNKMFVTPQQYNLIKQGKL